MNEEQIDLGHDDCEVCDEVRDVPALTRWRRTSKEPPPEAPEGFEEESFSVLTISSWGAFEIMEYDPVAQRWSDQEPLYWSRALEVLPQMPPVTGEEGWEE